MVEHSDPTLNKTFAALSDPTRRAILARLTQGQASMSELAEPFDVSLTAIFKHVKVLQKAGLINSEKQGRVHICRLAPASLKAATDWLATYQNFWADQFDSLAGFLEESDGEETQ